MGKREAPRTRAFDGWSAAGFEPISRVLASELSIKLAPHRLHLLQARLQARLQAEGCVGFSELVRRLTRAETRGAAVQLLIDLSTVNHTAFFRELRTLRAAADHLACLLVEGGRMVRAWSAGCSTGQEPYSLLMLLVDALGELGRDRLEFWATDLSLDAVKTGARGTYPERDLTGIEPNRLRRYFLRGRGSHLGSYRVEPPLRRIVTWAQLDLSSPSWMVPAGLDLILCRNVSIYFEEHARGDLFERLALHLGPGGLLVLGQGEILPARPKLLERRSQGVFRRILAR
jgi:chemotaxis protein methyltransferase CheR